MKTIQQFGKKYVGSFLMLLFLIAVTYYLIFRNCDVKVLQEVVSTSDWRFLFVGLCLVMIYICGEGLAIKVIGKSLEQPISVVKSFCYACIDFYYCGITPSASGGQPVLAYYMSKDGIAISKSTVIILVYTVIYKIVLLILGILTFFIHKDFILHNGNGVILLFIAGIIINLVIISVCLLFMYSKTVIEVGVTKCINFLHRVKIIRNPEKRLANLYIHLEEYHQSALFVKENKVVLCKVLFITMIQRIAMFSVGYMVYRSLGFTTLGFFDILALQVVISITVDSLPLPGAVGVTEGMFFLLYRIVYKASVIAPAMLLTRGITFYFCLLLCGIVTIVNQVLTVKPQGILKGERDT